MRAIIALKSDADVSKERWQFQICDLVYGGRCGRHFASSHRATTPGRSATLSLADDVRVAKNNRSKSVWILFQRKRLSLN
jgi:hypothetical protein